MSASPVYYRMCRFRGDILPITEFTIDEWDCDRCCRQEPFGPKSGPRVSSYTAAGVLSNGTIHASITHTERRPVSSDPVSTARPVRILQINSSMQGDRSNSTKLANMITNQLRLKYPGAVLEVLDLAKTPHPQIDGPAIGALFTPAEKRSPAQVARVALDDKRIAQLQAIDILVLGVPMYNFDVPIQLKAWVDAICRAGVTFKYGANGPEGLVKGKKVYCALARGGVYRDTKDDTQVPWLKKVLGFLGMTDITVFYVEGMARGDAVVSKAFADASQEIQNRI